MIQITAETFKLPAALPLEDGALLFNGEVAYETYGEPSSDRAIVLLHDLVHSHHAVGPAEDSPYQPSGWARELVGPGRIFDTRSYYVVSANLLGSPFGSTSPLTFDPETELPIGASFPPITIEDMARAVSALVRGLGIRKLRAVVGFGLGGMVALRLASLFAPLAQGVITLGAAKSLSEGLRERMCLTRQLLDADPAFLDGGYEPGQGPQRALRDLRLDILRRLSPARGPHTDHAQVERYLEAQAQAFSEVFDANAYALLCGAAGQCDLSTVLPEITARVLLVAMPGHALASAARVRDTYHALTAAGIHARLYDLPFDVDEADAVEQEKRLRGPLTNFLASL